MGGASVLTALGMLRMPSRLGLFRRYLNKANMLTRHNLSAAVPKPWLSQVAKVQAPCVSMDTPKQP